MLARPCRVRKEISIEPTGLKPPTGARNRRKKNQIIFTNPRSSIKPGSAHDPNFQ